MRADKKKIEKLLKTAKGQIDGILKMIEEDRYCIDVSNQILAAQSVLKTANREIIKSHLEGCVKEAIEQGSGKEKIDEIMKTIEKMTK